MKAIILVLLGATCLVSSSLLAQDMAFAIAMKNASVAHDTASSAESELLAIEACKKIIRQYPNAWAPYFWTSYYATQITRYPSIIRGEKRQKDVSHYLEMAQQNLDQATKLVPADANRIRSSFSALQALIYAFKVSSVPENEIAQYQARYREAISEAIQSSPDNPVVHVLLATDMIKEGQRDEDIRKLVAGKVMLNSAEETFNLLEENQIHHSLTHHFNQEWVSFWSSHVEKLIEDNDR